MRRKDKRVATATFHKSHSANPEQTRSPLDLEEAALDPSRGHLKVCTLNRAKLDEA